MVQRRVYRDKSGVEAETASFMSKRRHAFYWAGWRGVESEEGWGSRPGGSFGGLSLPTGRRYIFSCFYNRWELSGLAPVHVLVTVFCTLFMIIYFLGSLFQPQISEMHTFSPSFHLLYQTHSRGSVFTGRSSKAVGSLSISCSYSYLQRKTEWKVYSKFWIVALETSFWKPSQSTAHTPQR